ncbi:MAG: putative peptidase, partial [Pirellulaceae bacterium]
NIFRRATLLVALLSIFSGCSPAAKKLERMSPVQLNALSPGIHQQELPLPKGKHKLRYTISVPAEYDGQKKVPLVLALHYGGEVTPFYGRGVIEGLFGPGLKHIQPIIVAPDSLRGDWTTPENEQAAIFLIQSIQKTYQVDETRVLVAGFSMGGEGTWHIGGRNQDVFTAAMPVAGSPGKQKEWEIPIYAIHSTSDGVIPIQPTETRMRELEKQGKTVKFRRLTGISHFDTNRFTPAVREGAEWLEETWGGNH